MYQDGLLSLMDVWPGVSWGCVRLGMDVTTALSATRKIHKDLGKLEVLFKHRGAQQHQDLVLNFPQSGFELLFDTASTRLRIIHIYDTHKMEVRLMDEVIAGASQPLDFSRVQATLGLTYPGDFHPKHSRYLLRYPGIGLEFPVPPELAPLCSAARDHLLQQLMECNCPEASDIYIFDGTAGPHQRLCDISAPPPPLPCAPHTLPTAPATHHLTPSGAYLTIALNDSRATVEKQLGLPSCHTGPSCEALQVSTPSAASHSSSARQPNYSYVYDTIGLHVGFCGSSHSAIKFILATNSSAILSCPPHAPHRAALIVPSQHLHSVAIPTSPEQQTLHLLLDSHMPCAASVQQISHMAPSGTSHMAQPTDCYPPASMGGVPVSGPHSVGPPVHASVSQPNVGRGRNDVDSTRDKEDASPGTMRQGTRAWVGTCDEQDGSVDGQRSVRRSATCSSWDVILEEDFMTTARGGDWWSEYVGGVGHCDGSLTDAQELPDTQPTEPEAQVEASNTASICVSFSSYSIDRAVNSTPAEFETQAEVASMAAKCVNDSSNIVNSDVNSMSVDSQRHAHAAEMVPDCVYVSGPLDSSTDDFVNSVPGELAVVQGDSGDQPNTSSPSRTLSGVNESSCVRNQWPTACLTSSGGPLEAQVADSGVHSGADEWPTACHAAADSQEGHASGAGAAFAQLLIVELCSQRVGNRPVSPFPSVTADVPEVAASHACMTDGTGEPSSSSGASPAPVEALVAGRGVLCAAARQAAGARNVPSEPSAAADHHTLPAAVRQPPVLPPAQQQPNRMGRITGVEVEAEAAGERLGAVQDKACRDAAFHHEVALWNCRPTSSQEAGGQHARGAEVPVEPLAEDVFRLPDVCLAVDNLAHIEQPSLHPLTRSTVGHDCNTACDATPLPAFWSTTQHVDGPRPLTHAMDGSCCTQGSSSDVIRAYVGCSTAGCAEQGGWGLLGDGVIDAADWTTTNDCSSAEVDDGTPVHAAAAVEVAAVEPAAVAACTAVLTVAAVAPLEIVSSTAGETDVKLTWDGCHQHDAGASGGPAPVLGACEPHGSPVGEAAQRGEALVDAAVHKKSSRAGGGKLLRVCKRRSLGGRPKAVKQLHPRAEVQELHEVENNTGPQQQNVRQVVPLLSPRSTAPVSPPTRKALPATASTLPDPSIKLPPSPSSRNPTKGPMPSSSPSPSSPHNITPSTTPPTSPPPPVDIDLFEALDLTPHALRVHIPPSSLPEPVAPPQPTSPAVRSPPNVDTPKPPTPRPKLSRRRSTHTTSPLATVQRGSLPRETTAMETTAAVPSSLVRSTSNGHTANGTATSPVSSSPPSPQRCPLSPPVLESLVPTHNATPAGTLLSRTLSHLSPSAASSPEVSKVSSPVERSTSRLMSLGQGFWDHASSGLHSELGNLKQNVGQLTSFFTSLPQIFTELATGLDSEEKEVGWNPVQQTRRGGARPTGHFSSGTGSSRSNSSSPLACRDSPSGTPCAPCDTTGGTGGATAATVRAVVACPMTAGGEPEVDPRGGSGSEGGMSGRAMRSKIREAAGKKLGRLAATAGSRVFSLPGGDSAAEGHQTASVIRHTAEGTNHGTHSQHGLVTESTTHQVVAAACLAQCPLVNEFDVGQQFDPLDAALPDSSTSAAPCSTSSTTHLGKPSGGADAMPPCATTTSGRRATGDSHHLTVGGGSEVHQDVMDQHVGQYADDTAPTCLSLHDASGSDRHVDSSSSVCYPHSEVVLVTNAPIADAVSANHGYGASAAVGGSNEQRPTLLLGSCLHRAVESSLYATPVEATADDVQVAEAMELPVGSPEVLHSEVLHPVLSAEAEVSQCAVEGPLPGPEPRHAVDPAIADCVAHSDCALHADRDANHAVASASALLSTAAAHTEHDMESSASVSVMQAVDCTPVCLDVSHAAPTVESSAGHGHDQVEGRQEGGENLQQGTSQDKHFIGFQETSVARLAGGDAPLVLSGESDHYRVDTDGLPCSDCDDGIPGDNPEPTSDDCDWPIVAARVNVDSDELSDEVYLEFDDWHFIDKVPGDKPGVTVVNLDVLSAVHLGGELPCVVDEGGLMSCVEEEYIPSDMGCKA